MRAMQIDDVLRRNQKKKNLWWDQREFDVWFFGSLFDVKRKSKCILDFRFSIQQMNIDHCLNFDL